MLFSLEVSYANCIAWTFASEAIFANMANLKFYFKAKIATYASKSTRLLTQEKVKTRPTQVKQLFGASPQKVDGFTRQKPLKSPG